MKKSIYPPLFPKSNDTDRVTPNFGVIDIEASNWINFLVMGFYTKVYKSVLEDKKVVDKLYSHEICELFENITECASYLFSDEQPYAEIYAHFGGKYDFQFMMKEFYSSLDTYYMDGMIPRGSGLLCLEVSTIERVNRRPSAEELIRKIDETTWLKKKRSIKFWDSSALLSFSLASLTKNFHVDHKKKEFDFDTMTEVTEELKEYLVYDLKGLYEVIETFHNQPLIRGSGFAKTIAGQSMKVFQTYLEKPIYSLTDEVDQFVRSSYFGGRTEIFKPCFLQMEDDELLSTFDVNSLYPYVMRENEYPGAFKRRTLNIDYDEIGFFDVEVEVPEMYVPPLGLNYGLWKRLIFPTGRFRGVWSTAELEYAETLGMKIKRVFDGMTFHSAGPIFREFIDDIYAMRKAAGKESVDNIICKLIMNSLYGRFGLLRDREKLIIDQLQLGVSHFSEHIATNGEEFRLVTEKISLDSSFAHVGIAAWVTSHARIHMHKQYMLAPDELYYTDTDSLFSTHHYPKNEADLGQLKLEYSCDASCFLLPKTYIINSRDPIWNILQANGKELKDETGKSVKTSKKVVMKGFDKRKLSHFKLEDFYTALEGDLRYMKSVNPEKFATFKTAARDGKFLKLLAEAPRQIRSRYDKRRIIKRHYSQIWDTEALHIRDGVISNMPEKKKYDEEDIDWSMSETDIALSLMGVS